MLKFLRSDEKSSVNNVVNVMRHPYTTNAMVDYVRPVIWKKPDAISIHVGMNDLTKGANI